MHELMDKTCDALEELEKSGKVNIMDSSDRRIISELVDLKKNLLKVEKLEDEREGGYSEAIGDNYERSSSYANRRRDSMGRYSRDDGMDGRYSSRRDSRGRYSRDDGRSEMMEHLEMALDSATEQDREDIRRFMQKMKNA